MTTIQYKTTVSIEGDGKYLYAVRKILTDKKDANKMVRQAVISLGAIGKRVFAYNIIKVYNWLKEFAYPTDIISLPDLMEFIY